MHAKTVRRAIARGELRAARLGTAGALRVREEDVGRRMGSGAGGVPAAERPSGLRPSRTGRAVRERMAEGVIQRRERRRRDGGEYCVWRVRWHDAHGTERNRTFDTKIDAETFEAKVRLAKRAGDLPALDAGRQLLADFAEEWWELYARPNLQRRRSPTTPRSGTSTRFHGSAHCGCATCPPPSSRSSGATWRPTVSGRRPLARLVVLQSMLRCAVEWERIASNPVRAVRKPSAKRTRAVRPLAPLEVERLRAWLLDNCGLRGATLVSVLAYSGVRPQEALALRWRSIGERTLLVEQAVADGQLKGQKTGRPPRTVRLLGPLRNDLAELALASGRPDDETLIFPSARSGALWALHDSQNWRRRTFGGGRACGRTRRRRPV